MVGVAGAGRRAGRRKGTRIRVREATPEDSEAVARIYAPIVGGTAISFEETPPDAYEIRDRMARSHIWLVIEGEEGVLGYAYATRFHPRSAYRWSCEASVYLAEHARGRGNGRRLLRGLLQRVDRLGLVNVFAGITLPNQASVALFESFGFTRTALWRNAGFKLGRWHDVAWWQLQLREPSVPPPDLKSGSAVPQSGHKDATGHGDNRRGGRTWTR